MICPFTVITLKKVPKSLRGDLTKWMQEIATGVYVGNFNTKVREKLWDRVIENVDGGEATMSFSYRNEIGYNFCTLNTDREVVDFDGIPLVMISNKSDVNVTDVKSGFSNIAKFRKSKKFSKTGMNTYSKECELKYVVGLAEEKCIGNENRLTVVLLKHNNGIEKEFNATFIEIGNNCTISNLEVSDDEGCELSMSSTIDKFIEFVGEIPIVIYDCNHEIDILSNIFNNNGYDLYKNKIYDLMKFVKKENRYFDDYKLENVLIEYDIEFEDKIDIKYLVNGLYDLSTKVNKFTQFIGKE